MDFAICEMRAAESRLSSVLSKGGSCSGLDAKARFAFSCLKQACCLQSSPVVFHGVLCARAKTVQGHDLAKVFPTSVVLGVTTAGRRVHWSVQMCTSARGSHGLLEQPLRLPVPKSFGHYISTVMESTPILEPAQFEGPLPPATGKSRHKTSLIQAYKMITYRAREVLQLSRTTEAHPSISFPQTGCGCSPSPSPGH